MHPRSLLTGLLALSLAAGMMVPLASLVWAASPSAQSPYAAPLAGDLAPSPATTRTVVDLATRTATSGSNRKPGTTSTSTPSSSGFLTDKILGINTTFVALGVLAILVVLAFVMTFVLIVRARRRRSARRQPAAAGAASPTQAEPLEQAQPLPTLNPPLPVIKDTRRLRQEDISAQAPQQPPHVRHPLEHTTPPVKSRPLAQPPAAALAQEPAAPVLPSTAGTMFCPQCGLQQQISSSPCPRCGYDLHQALTRVQRVKQDTPAAPTVPHVATRVPAPAEGPLPFVVAADGGTKLPGREEAAPQQGPLSGQVLSGKYQLEELLGRGGVGVVYKAHNHLLKRPQAVKVLLEHYVADAKFQERFLREAQTLAALDHANILHVDDFGLEEHRAYLVMPFISGGTLEQVLKRRGSPLEVEQVRRALGHIAAALDYAHAQGVVHLDLKPANMLLHSDGRLLLSDFGLAHLLEAGAVEGGTSLQFGTPSYMAPEHIDGQPEPASDIYALGIVLYQVLTGQLPFQGSSPLAIIRKQATEPPPPLRRFRPDLPVTLEGVLGKALAKQPAARYQSAGALLAAFQQVISA